MCNFILYSDEELNKDSKPLFGPAGFDEVLILLLEILVWNCQRFHLQPLRRNRPDGLTKDNDAGIIEHNEINRLASTNSSLLIDSHVKPLSQKAEANFATKKGVLDMERIDYSKTLCLR